MNPDLVCEYHLCSSCYGRILDEGFLDPGDAYRDDDTVEPQPCSQCGRLTNGIITYDYNGESDGRPA